MTSNWISLPDCLNSNCGWIAKPSSGPGLTPNTVIRTLQLLADGESVASFIDQDEPVGVRVRADQDNDPDIAALLQHTVARADGSSVPLSQLVIAEQRVGPASIDHIDFQRVLTLQADIDKD